MVPGTCASDTTTALLNQAIAGSSDSFARSSFNCTQEVPVWSATPEALDRAIFCGYKDVSAITSSATRGFYAIVVVRVVWRHYTAPQTTALLRTCHSMHEDNICVTVRAEGKSWGDPSWWVCLKPRGGGGLCRPATRLVGLSKACGGIILHIDGFCQKRVGC